MNRSTDIFTELSRIIDGEVHTDALKRYMMSTDGSIFRVQPACVVYPKTKKDVVRTVTFANTHGISVHPRGAGSGLCGSALGRGIVLDFTRYMNRLISLDEKGKWFQCEPGYRFGELQARLAGKGLFFPPDPSSGEYATFGGMVGTNASGAHSVKYGNTADYLLDAEVVLGSGRVVRLTNLREMAPDRLPDDLKALYDLYSEHGETIERAYPPVRYNSTGYNLRGLVKNDRLNLYPLFAGAEGTLGVATRLKFRLLEKPGYDSLVVAFFDDIVRSARAVQEILPMGPSGIEIMDKSLLNLARENDPALRNKIPDGVDNVLLIEFDGSTQNVCTAPAQEAKAILEAHGLTNAAHLVVSPEEKEKFWAVRKAAVPILYQLKGRKKILALIEDAAVPTEHLVAYFEGIYRILNARQVRFVLYGHIAKGLIHTRPLLDLKDPGDLPLLRALADEIFELVHSLGGAVSGEHGDGRLRTAYIEKQYPKIHPLFRKVKQMLDPANILNPEIKTVHDPDQMAKDLRFGESYRGLSPIRERLRWPEGFASEIECCHGCAKCTTVTAITRMCPIYKFTRDEAASPRAKANVLRALISGSVTEESLYDAAFQEVIDHCVNCGSCFKECPSNVNIPKMALEAKAQYVRRYGPSVESRLTANIEVAGRVFRKFSPVVAPMAGTRFGRKAMEIFSGLSARRDPVLPVSRSLFERLGPVEGQGRVRVLYFSGCYAGYIRPEIGQAAVRVLKRLGMTVDLPQQHCCGLPMLSKGMAKDAKGKIGQNLNKWGDLVETVDHIVVTCSSCGLSLMQEWAYLAGRPAVDFVKSKVIHISRLIHPLIERLELNPGIGRVAYHMPCHLKIQPDPESSLKMLSRVPGLTIENLDSHCCGMAGSWGMSADNVDLSMKIGADLMAKLDAAGAATGVTDCPTCRIQMEQMGDLPIRHPVEILAERMA